LSVTQMVDDLECEYPLVGPLEPGSEQITVDVPNPIADPLAGDDLPPDARTAWQVQHCRGESRGAPTQLSGEPAGRPGDVQQALRMCRQRYGARYLRRREPGQLKHRLDVLVPTRVLGRIAVNVDART